MHEYTQTQTLTLRVAAGQELGEGCVSVFSVDLQNSLKCQEPVIVQV
jgi:hypothetical protein